MQIIPSLFLCFIISLNLLPSPIHSTSSGFSINLIHRDSPLSPYYNSSLTYYEIVRNSIRRSMARSSHFFTPELTSSPPTTIQSPLTAYIGEYLMKISVGTPPQDFLAVADTGSDLTWINCKPCIDCYQQTAPLFDPNKSSTYKIQPCQSKICQEQHFSCGDNNHCHYEVVYGDNSFSEGDASLESFTFEATSGKPVVLPNISFGCGHKAGGNFDNATDGIVGLGNSDQSIINQFKDTINGKFSYCMVPLKLNVTSKISFGSDAIVSGSGVQTTPFFTKDQTLYYYLYLESVGVGEANVKFNTESYMNNVNAQDGNIIIDSGTTLTYLPIEFYQQVEEEFKKQISSTPVPGEEELTLCYQNEEGFKEQVPTITFQFPGAKLELGVSNTMLEMEDGKLCFTIAPGGEAIFGNSQQLNYLVGYDLEGKTVSFKKADCSKL